MNLRVFAAFDTGIVLGLPTSEATVRSEDFASAIGNLDFISLPFGKPIRCRAPLTSDIFERLSTVEAFELDEIHVDFYPMGIATIAAAGSTYGDASSVFRTDQLISERLFASGDSLTAPLIERYAQFLGDAVRIHLPYVEVGNQSAKISWTYSVLACAATERETAWEFIQLTGRAFETVRLLTGYGAELRFQGYVTAHVGVRHAVFDGVQRERNSDSASLMEYSTDDYEDFMGYYMASWESFRAMNDRLTGTARRLWQDARLSNDEISAVLERLAYARGYLRLLRQGFTPFNFGPGESILNLVDVANRVWKTADLLAAYDEKTEFIDAFYSQNHDRLSQAQGYRLSKIALAFTILTLASVVADLVNTIDYQNQIVPSHFVRGVLLATPPLLSAVLTFVLWRKRL